MKYPLLIIFALVSFVGIFAYATNAQQVITFGPNETKIVGSIPYSVIGTYRAEFGVFKGIIIFDESSENIRSVGLTINVRSIHSNCPWCDRVARSRRLLNAARYPEIIFKSDNIIHDENGYRVNGILEMHGIKRRIAFPFKVTMRDDLDHKRKWLDLKGSWRINRKDFNIVWNKYLDHGGIVVGDYFTVNWGIRVF